MIQHLFGMISKPSATWRTVAAMPEKSRNALVLYPCIMAVFPAIA